MLFLLPLSQAVGHITQVNICTNKFCMNYWWILEAAFLLSSSELPVIEPWLWQHAKQWNIHRDTYGSYFLHGNIKRRNRGSACVYICITCLLYAIFPARLDAIQWWSSGRSRHSFGSLPYILQCSCVPIFYHKPKCFCLQQACMILHSFNSLWE